MKAHVLADGSMTPLTISLAFYADSESEAWAQAKKWRDAEILKWRLFSISATDKPRRFIVRAGTS